MMQPGTREKSSIQDRGAFISRGFLLVAISMLLGVGVGIAVFASVAR
jgi:hypothetical protein